MSWTDALPTDAVLRRHAITERNRLLGLPPTDAVLRRHHAQWEAAEAARAAAPVAPAAAKPQPVAARPTPPSAAPVRPAPATAAPAMPSVTATTGGGWLGWLKRLFGG